MQLLILGGTQFVGKHLVHEALRGGHHVSIFTRGRQDDDLPLEVERLRGDRDGQLGALRGRSWDAAIDVSGYVPRVVRQSAQLLSGAVSRYAFISTISVYEDLRQEGVTEDAPLAMPADPTSEDVSAAYGPLKVLCEGVVREVYAERATIVRPGLIVGPWDHTDRFTFWAQHLAHDQAFPLFGSPTTPLQVIDARDLAAFTLRLLERGQGGTFNAVGERLTWEDLVRAVGEAHGHAVRPRWLDFGVLEDSGLELPLVGRGWADAMRVSDARAREAGLHRRPLTDTVRDLLGWLQETRRDVKQFGFTSERLRELLSRSG